MTLPATSKAIPVTLVIGTLGAGKTTLLQQLLYNKPTNQSWAVLVNDIGEGRVDGRVLSPFSDGFQAIEGNCLCCSGKVESVSAIDSLLDDVAGPFERLVIEASGVSDPLNLITLLGDNHFAERLILERIVAVVNVQTSVVQALRNSATTRAIACADIIALSHTDIAKPEETAHWFEALQHLSPQKGLVCTNSELTVDNLATRTAQLWKQRMLVGGDIGLSVSPPTLNKAHLKRTDRMALFNPNWSRIDQFYQNMSTALWRFHPDSQFNYETLSLILNDNDYQRIKGILKTDQGWCFVNSTPKSQTCNLIPKQQSENWTESRLEGIAEGDVDWTEIETLLMKSLLMKRNDGSFQTTAA
ncbi:GTP-binding protein [Vibrio methylphosphonaticus]|uniref:GTP-binding protein n=1 Tax=Vibrio methylphosphonaticus TaxID=2946866 RepID=UPI00202A8BDB|nr:GTP-binding protein [Vibrio methylphosphonaticus]MCL9776112.1 hypothetical protein [Vibrio methylphosphonaticus]